MRFIFLGIIRAILECIMIDASVGVGGGTDAYRAGRDATVAALAGLPNNKANVVFVFASVAFDQDKLIEGVVEATPDSLIIGCSTAGEISSEGFAMEKGVVVMGIASDQMEFFGGLGHHVLWNPKQAGEECANTIQYASHGHVQTALFFLDIISGNGEKTLGGILNHLGQDFPIWGGGAADDLLFFETYQYLNDKVYSGSVVGVGMSGEFTAAGVVMHGFLPIGVERHVTKAEGNTLYELDGKPAASIYEEYFGEAHISDLHEGLLPSLAVSYPLGVFLPESNEVMLRNPVFVDQKWAMTFTASIPEGSEVRLMISDTEHNLEVAELAARKVLEQLNGKKPKAVIIMNSVARKKMLGPRADEEIAIIQKVFGRDVPMAGFYNYAQIGGQIGTRMPFHNGSLLIWALAE